MSVPPVPVLSSWKEIASYLGVGVRTAQGYEQERGLPVHRLPGPRGRVYVTVAELEAWKQPATREATVRLPAQPGRRLLFLGLVGLIVLVLVGLFWPRRLSSVRVEQDALVALDGKGVVLWRRAFGTLDLAQYAIGDRRLWHGMLGGVSSVLFVPIPQGMAETSVPLVCFDARGKERWRFVPGKTVTRQGETLAPPFVVRQFAIIGDKIIVTSHHALYYPSQVAILDDHGRLLREYWHPGHLNALTTGAYAGRRVAFLGGVNNRRHRATIVVLDPERCSGAAVEDDHPAFDGMTRGVEAARIIFPRSTLTPSDPYNVVTLLAASHDHLQIGVQERLNGNNPPTILYHLSQRLGLDQVVLSDIFLSDYQQQTNHDITPAEESALHQLTHVQ